MWLANRRWTVWVEPEHLLTEPQARGVLDYRVVEESSVSADLAWTIERRGLSHGLCLWYESTLLDGVGFSNAPGGPMGVYPHTFLPFEQPLELAPGDEVRVRLRATYAGGDYVWRWSGQVTAGHQVKTAFDQSSFESKLVSPSRLERSSVSHVPKLRPEGEVLRATLELMDGQRSLSEIAEALAARFPTRFADPDDALSAVTDVSQQLSV